MVDPHLLVAARFLPTREGSGTKSTRRRPKSRCYSSGIPREYLVRCWVWPYLFIFWMFWVFGFLLHQTFRHWCKKSHAPPALPRNDPVRSHSSSDKRVSLSDGLLKVSGGVPRERRCPKPYSCCVSFRAHRKRPALPPTLWHHVLHSHRKSHREVFMCSRCSSSLASLMIVPSRSRRPPSSRSTQSCGSTPCRRSLVDLVGRARQ